MFVLSPWTRLHQPGWLSGAIHLGIIVAAFQTKSSEVWPYALLGMSVVSFFAWVANYRRFRQIHDLPTSRVASAAQGYVELFGRTELLPGELIRSKLSRTPCCWYSYVVEEKDSQNKWNTIDRGASVEHFLLVDDTGQCVVSPEGAEVLPHDRKSWDELDRRFTEWLLLPKTVIYAIGEFSTITAGAVAANMSHGEHRQLRRGAKCGRARSKCSRARSRVSTSCASRATDGCSCWPTNCPTRSARATATGAGRTSSSSSAPAAPG